MAENKNTRKPGYYWVKVYRNSKWECALFTLCEWWRPLDKTARSDSFFIEINETRIPSPDEAKAMSDLKEATEFLRAQGNYDGPFKAMIIANFNCRQGDTLVFDSESGSLTNAAR